MILLLQQFNLIIFNQAAGEAMSQLQSKLKTRKRYADVMIAAMALAGDHIVVTRNQTHFVDILPSHQLANWIDNPPT